MQAAEVRSKPLHDGVFAIRCAGFQGHADFTWLEIVTAGRDNRLEVLAAIGCSGNAKVSHNATSFQCPKNKPARIELPRVEAHPCRLRERVMIVVRALSVSQKAPAFKV